MFPVFTSSFKHNKLKRQSYIQTDVTTCALEKMLLEMCQNFAQMTFKSLNLKWLEIDNKQNFESQIKSVCSKASRKLGP